MSVMRSLLQLYRETGDKKYLKPLPRAIEYLKRSRLSDGRLARFYELQTNRPLYFTTRYEITYRDDDMPTHYCFKANHDLDAFEREYERVCRHDPKKLSSSPRLKVSDQLREDVRRVLAALDEQGRWVDTTGLRYHGPSDPTRRVIDSATFCRNVRTLSRYLAAVKSIP